MVANCQRQENITLQNLLSIASCVMNAEGVKKLSSSLKNRTEHAVIADFDFEIESIRPRHGY